MAAVAAAKLLLPRRIMATHGLAAQGKATVRTINQNRRDVVFNVFWAANLFASGAKTPELQRLQWNPNAASPYPASIRFRDRGAGFTGGGAGPHLNDPEDFTYMLRLGGVVHSFTTPASDEVEPYDFNLGKALFDALAATPSGTEVDFAIINTAAWGTRPLLEAFDRVPVAGVQDHLEGVVAMGFEIPELGIRYWSLDEDAEIDGQTWIGDSRLNVVSQSIDTTNSQVVIEVRLGPEQVPSRGGIMGNDVILRWWHRRNGRWVRIPNSFPGKVANIRLSGLVMTLTIDPGPFPQTLDQRQFSNEDQQALHPGDRYFEYTNKYRDRERKFLWPFFIKPESATVKEVTTLRTKPIPSNLPPRVNDFDILLPPSPISTTPLRYAPVRTVVQITDPEGDRTTVKWVDPVTGVATDARTITTSVGTHTLAGNEILSTRTIPPEAAGTDSVTIAVVDPDGSADEVRQTGTVNAPNRAYTRIRCPATTPTLFLTSGQQNIYVNIAGFARYDTRFGFRLVSVEVPTDNADELTARLAPTADQPGRVEFDVGTVTEESRFQIVWTAQHTIGDTDPTICRINVVIRPDQAFQWTDEKVTIQVRERPESTDGGGVADHTLFLDGYSIPRNGNTYRVKTPPVSTKATVTIEDGFKARTNFVDPYPFPEDAAETKQQDTVQFVLAGRREVPSGGDASLPLYAEDDMTVCYEVLPAGATLSGNACELAIGYLSTVTNRMTGDGTEDSPFVFSVGAGGSFSIDARDLVYPTVGGGAIALAEGNAQIIETHSNNPEIWSLSFDDAETPGVVDVTGTGLGVASGWFRVKNRLCPDDAAIRVYVRGQTNVLYAIWPQKIARGTSSIYSPSGQSLTDSWGIPVTAGNQRTSSFILNFDQFLPIADPDIKFRRIQDYQGPESAFGPYDHSVRVSIERTQPSFGKKRMWAYYWPTGATYQQDILLSPHANHDIFSAPAQPGPPYILGEGFVGGITPGNVLTSQVRPGTPGGLPGSDALVGQAFSLTLNERAWGAWLSFAEGVTQLLGNAVFQNIGGTIGGTVTTVEAYSFSQFTIAQEVAKTINEKLAELKDALDFITEQELVAELTMGIGSAVAVLATSFAGPIGVAGGLAGISAALNALLNFEELGARKAQIESILTSVEFVEGLEVAVRRAMAITETVTNTTEYAARAAEVTAQLGSLTSGGTTTVVEGGTTVGGVTAEGGTLTSNVAVPASTGEAAAAAVTRSVWANIGSAFSLLGWLRNWNTLMSKLVETQAVRFGTVDHNIATVRGVVRSGTLVGNKAFKLEGTYWNPGETLLTATGIVNGKPWKNVPLPVILRTLNPERDWRDD